MAQDVTKMESSASVTPVKVYKAFRTMSFGVNGGALMPIAAFGPRGDFSDYSFKPGYGFFLKQQFGHTLGFQADFLMGSVKGSNSGRKNPSLPWTFDTDINWSGSVSTNVTFGNISFLRKKAVFLPYGTVGVGLIDYSTYVTTKASVKEPTKTAQMLFVPVSVGTKIALSSVINLDLGYKIGFVGSDGFDGVYGAPGAKIDKFTYAYGGLEFILGKKAKPALGRVNPITSIISGFDAKYDDLRKELEAEKAVMANEAAKLAAENAKMLEEQKKFMTDTDNDGVADYFDKCPSTPTTTKVDGAGCPLPSFVVNKPADVKIFITESDKKILKDAVKNLQFDLGKSTIQPSSFASLDKVVDLLVTKNFNLKLSGHTDNVGKAETNLILSKNRAEAVKNYMISKGANGSKIEAVGYGKTQPIATNKTAKGRKLNRRVVFLLF
ncbi:MAG: OmpA family protein [Sphingobacteriales bacterium]|nr:MAG: OmpA family protein [Sphingobacteriales bacterium]